MFRKAKTSQEDEISDDLLNSVPDLEPGKGPFSHFARKEPAREFAVVDATDVIPLPPSSVEPLAATAPPEAAPTLMASRGAAPMAAAADEGIRALLDQVRQQMEGVFRAEMGRVEASFDQLLHQMEARLAQANAELAAARAEHERVKAENDRKVEALRELKRTLESI